MLILLQFNYIKIKCNNVNMFKKKKKKMLYNYEKMYNIITSVSHYMFH